MTTHSIPTGFDTLAARVHGPVFRPGQDGYDAECAGFQTGLRHRPDVVVGATGAADVRAAVEFAATNELPIAVQATGHGVAEAACGGMLISTRRMAGVRIDPATRTAWIDAGTRWAEVIDAAAPHGLAPLSGSSPDVGAVGYTLGGGLGLLSRRFGYAADHVRTIDVVTTDGVLHRVTAESDPELFWALRGGHGNLGVVTAMEVDLMPVDRIYGGRLMFDTELVDEALRVYLEWTATVPDELTSSVSLMRYPDFDGVPEPFRGRYFVQVRVAHLGEPAEGERLVAPLRDVGPRLLDTLGELPFTASASICADPAEPHAYRGDSLLLRDLDLDALRSVIAIGGPDAPIMCVVQLNHLGGALARPPAVPNAVSHRDARFLLRVLSPVEPSEPSEVDIAAGLHGRVLDALEPWSAGAGSVNFRFAATGPADRARPLHDAATRRGLVAAKAAHDPGNLLRVNNNIPPEGSAGRG
ncbi:FAD-linked oxidoreductase [Amycolatopsis antarctica]|uniref:FAD-linked oxidoreductase n=1 Tax=Amycolatopsis antarctica TaxID=1854586 RepID=A0A263D4W8_9PSEU|nr:FAD-binding oxidoreductase [Amycolatopsis antarctica]OZM72647.1 FAD-linked oxidoreductase [Amycolatopsis antarctica]